MEYLITVLKLIVGLSLLNVWLLQRDKNTKWRGGNASTLSEEFKVYGLSPYMFKIVGGLKIILAIGLLLSIYYTSFASICAIGLAILLTGSIAMHLKIKDPLFKSFPAALFLTLCLIIALS
ncbi:DoxX family protein [Winogradskyella jejuensis]|uniref:DoxX-like family protein n=1 Tax=Winogradskyella jejuensis TaxID=1089305 RepID=A0A1M5UCD7_9FLAO|nr:DoxX family protein [Winogradskyella jejuensis]SHH60496.1 DoxX-like family protein [Winogradskyella jejuensis]